MNQFFLVIGATLCYVGGFGIMIFILGILTELCIEIWDSDFRQLCVRFQIEPGDVAYFAQQKKEIESLFSKSRPSWPGVKKDFPGQWRCPECGTMNQYDEKSESVAYCQHCGQAADMNFYRRKIQKADFDE